MLVRLSGDYSLLDRPEVLVGIFHPRPEYVAKEKPRNAIDVLIPVEDDIVVGGRFHLIGKSAPNILFFHGNGEIVADYDELGPLYNSMGMNFVPVDYRGYGRSSGRPTVTSMMRDCHAVFEFVKHWLGGNDYTGALIVMGRSLGSASALELATHHKDRIDALIVESGFAHTGPLLQLLGVSTSAIGFSEEKGFRNLEKIRTWNKPILIIHAEFDHIIPFSDGQALYNECPSSDRTFIKIPGANHNDIFARGLDRYMKAVKSLSETLSRSTENR
ncbi:MAG: alpha/beta hydrolase [Deltaproteobacteria bacterium]|nr:alpha/beta hydrolase [Deltaproteobacteria bacterium]MBW1920311.1 alpha/beta hydrolase [Deltaproteobacteria bacterium]MBW1936199.1 alpha/beta hydrolase [Deltaproteobacteria bacterium]